MRKRKRLLTIILFFSLLAVPMAACTPAETPPPSTATQGETSVQNTPTTTPESAEADPGTAAPEETPQDTLEATEPAEPFQPVAALAPIAQGLTAPVALTAPDDGSERLFVVDQIGLIFIIDGEDTLLQEPFLDLRDQLVGLNGGYDERGLLGLAFHPNYADNGRLFVYYSAPLRPEGPGGWDHTSHISEFSVSAADPDRADPNSERIILQVDQPQGNHNAGAIAFGPDGYLYVPLGDGGGGGDTGPGHASDWYAANAGGNGQNVEANMLGSVLRLDVDRGDPYAIPGDNPAISEAFPEIWAYGFRNPYRMAFDPAGEGELFLGDAGQELWEEVSIVEAGGNYGWNVREGNHCYSTASPANPDAITNCPETDPGSDPLIPPIIEFANSKNPAGGVGLVIIGGVVYRGQALPAWNGRYLFGQWSRSAQQPDGGLFAASRPAENNSGLWPFEMITIANRPDGALGAFLLAFGQDTAGEVYILTSQATGPSGQTGKVFRLVAPQE
jgi:glucose/arabinose dehydrogenase